MTREYVPAEGTKFKMQLCKALGLPVNMVHRIVLDVQVGKPIIAYAELYGSDNVLDLDWGKGLQGASVTVLDKTE
jgi:hypothetical protein